MNKKAFELSINFIVMLILSIAVFGFGLYFAGKVFSEAKEIKAQLDRDSEERVNLMLDRGEKVAFPVTNKEIKTNQAAVFGLGVLNVNDAASTSFAVTIECSTYISKGNVEDKSKCDGKWTFDSNPSTPNIFEMESFSLVKNEKKIIPIAIQPPSGKPEGTYAFTVRVTADGKPYGTVKQIYVNLV